MFAFQPKYTQPFTFEQACQLDAPTIAEEISRLQNSLRALSSTQKQLQDAMAVDVTPDADLQQAFQENLGVIGSQEERIMMLRKALEAQGAAIADSPHYQVHASSSPPPVTVSTNERGSDQISNENDESGGVYL
ncbi:hypothetical protein RSOLAG1IB_03620 [Rhizoctonia solani AG-1 IB]|uniref:Uncharacterized protein n=1 Tax=Thanatephorus cucumeris (strain AG1-IB / isolate 7/3/14) TaxID=1108050 RepID=A0A0B7FU39_THACB|nr:hypothetical protein RSOLAG1IB_03620 [Rhizoctonia solani AG-1 IB]